MTLSLAIALNTIAAAGIIGLLAFAMSRPSRLRPHLHDGALRAEQRLEHALAGHRRSARPAVRPARTVATAR